MNKKVIAKILVFCMMIMLVQWCVPVNDVYATEYNYESEYDGNLNWQIRNSPPLENNQYYYNSSYNVNAGGSYGMPNCTTYVIGRVYEATGVKFKDLKGSGSGASGDAGQWFTNNKNNGIYPYSTDAYSPKVGAVVCYSGHVEIVEVIGNDSGGQYICVSESNYSGRDSGKETKRFNYKKIYLDALNASKTSNFVKCTFLEDNDGYDEENRSGSYGTFQGYIYTVDSVSSTPTIEYNSSRFKNLSTEYWTDTTAKIATTFPEESYDDMGFYFGTSNSISSMTKVSEKKDTSVTFPHVSPGNSYRLGEEYPGYGYKWWNPLTPGTTYYWAFYLKQGNTEYISTVQSFTTTGGGDTQAPVLGDGGAVSGDGKVTISGSVSDNVGVSYVGIEIYPAGRSDLKKTAECVASDGHYSFEFNISQFNNIIGDYVYKLHAIDTSGNSSAVSTATIYIPGIELKGISLNKTSLALEKSESEKLTVTYNPDNTTDVKTVTWTSSDTSVATVNSSGTVTGISHGTAIITAKVGNYTAKCEVEVDMRIKGISLNKANINLVVGEGDELSVICNPSHLTNSAMVTWWSSSNESVATVSNFGGTVTAIAPGTAIITAKIATGHTATCTVTVTAASTTSKLNTPQNPTFTWTPWFVISYDKVDNASGYSIILYKDGSEIRNIDNISITEYTCADILEQYGSGGYTFKVRANGTGSFTNSDWATSGTFNYTVPNQKYGMVDGVKWKDGVLSWNPVENAGKYTAYRITLCDATTNKGITMFKTLNCEIDLSKRMEVGKTYYARIYVESQNINKIASGDGYAKSSNYTYGVEVKVPISGVSLNTASATLTSIGATKQLTATVAPSNATNKNVTWTSSNTSVATVSSNGLVTAKGNGTATITVKTADGGYTATCTVKVNAVTKFATPQNVKFSTKSNRLFAGFTAVDKAEYYTVEFYKDGVKIHSHSSNSIGLYCAGMLEENGSGTYCFKVKAKATSEFAESEWGISDTFVYKTPEIMYGVVDGIKWNDGVISWNPITYKGEKPNYHIMIYDTNHNWVAGAMTTDCYRDFNHRLENGQTYYALITVESPDINLIKSSDSSAKSGIYTHGQISTVSTPMEGFVERMYTVALNRPFDATGKANWVAALNAGTHDGAAIAKEFISGQEFALRNLSNEEYIETLYETFFDRASDASGKSNWLNHLAVGYSREFVLANFVNSEEFTNLCQSFGVGRGVMKDNGTTVNPGVPKFVDRLYSTVMGRKADWQGYTNWTMALAAKQQSAEQVAKSFFTSQEYLNKDTNNTTFITDLYRTFFDREPDSSGMANWKNCLNSGMTRNTVIAEFAKSAEFKAIAASYGLE